MDFTAYGRKPVFQVAECLGRYLMNVEANPNVHVLLQKNFIYSYDKWFLNVFLSVNDYFFTSGEVIEESISDRFDEVNIFSTIYWIHPQIITHERQVYSFVNMGEELGGIIEIMVVFCSIFVLPISTFSFKLKAIRNLFFVRTSQRNLLMKAK